MDCGGFPRRSRDACGYCRPRVRSYDESEAGEVNGALWCAADLVAPTSPRFIAGYIARALNENAGKLNFQTVNPHAA